MIVNLPIGDELHLWDQNPDFLVHQTLHSRNRRDWPQSQWNFQLNAHEMATRPMDWDALPWLSSRSMARLTMQDPGDVKPYDFGWPDELAHFPGWPLPNLLVNQSFRHDPCPYFGVKIAWPLLNQADALPWPNVYQNLRYTGNLD